MVPTCFQVSSHQRHMQCASKDGQRAERTAAKGRLSVGQQYVVTEPRVKLKWACIASGSLQPTGKIRLPIGWMLSLSLPLSLIGLLICG
jgi:hypothetical protein